MAAVQERLTLRNAYLYLVCLLTLLISVFAAVTVVRSTVELLYPDPGYPTYEGPVTPGPGTPDRGAQRALAMDSQRRQAVLELVGAGTTLLIAGPLYVYHWRRVQNELPPPRDAGGAAPPPAP